MTIGQELAWVRAKQGPNAANVTSGSSGCRDAAGERLGAYGGLFSLLQVHLKVTGEIFLHHASNHIISYAGRNDPNIFADSTPHFADASEIYGDPRRLAAD